MSRFKKICIWLLCLASLAFSSAYVYNASAANNYNQIYKQDIKVELTELSGISSFDFKLQGSYSLDGTDIVIGDATYTLKLDSGAISLFKGTDLIKQYMIGSSVGITPQNYTGSRLTVISNSRQYIGGFNFTVNGAFIRIVNRLGIDEYLYGVVPFEMSDSYPQEALKAQAIAARTYAFNKMINPKSTYYDLKSDTSDQVYKGYNSSYKNSISAVNSTKGGILTYGGTPISAYFSASDGGYTEKSDNVWNGSDPYVVSKPDPYDTSYNWTRTFTTAEINSRLSPSVKQVIGDFTAVDLNTITKYESGRISNITLNGTLGSYSFSKNSARTFLYMGDSKDLPSALYTVAYDQGTDTYTFKGSGYGHGVGMSQIGAQNRANAGQSCSDILSFYYNAVQENYFISVTGITPSSSTIQMGQSVDFTTSAAGGNQLLYQYNIINLQTGTTTMVQDYSTNPAFRWTFADPGKYKVMCCIKDINSVSLCDAAVSSDITVNIPPITVNSITPAQLITYAGKKETVTVSASGGTSLLYQFQIVNSTAGTSSTVQDYSANPSLTWSFSQPGSYQIACYIKDKTSSVYDKAAYCDVTVNDGSAAVPLNNLAAGKAVTSSSAFKNLSLATDGAVLASGYADSALNSGLQWVQVDLGASYDVNSIRLWHYFGDARKYHDVIVQLSNDPAFQTGVTTVYNNDSDNSAGFGSGPDSEYAETSTGLNLSFNSVSARYARFYSNGSTVNSYSHYSEIEVYTSNLVSGKAASASSTFKNLSLATDGIAAAGSYADSGTNTGMQWLQLDLGSSVDIGKIMLWHYFGDSRKYHDVVVQLSNDPEFKTGVATVFNNDADNSSGLGAGTDSEYAETSAGKSITFSTINARYVRLYSNGSTVNRYNHYAEIDVQSCNQAAGKAATASADFKNLSMITDGTASADKYADSGLTSGLQWVQVDMGSSCDVNSLRLWHYFGDARQYHDVIVQLSNDPTFATGVTTVFNNDADNSAGLGAGTDSEYAETSDGKAITFGTINARYARFYSNGSTVNSYNHYSEIQICMAGLAAGKVPEAPVAFKNLAAITDGVMAADKYADSGSSTGLQWVQLDMGAAYNVGEVDLWHYFGDARKYRDVIVQLSNDPTFTTGVSTVFNNDTDNSAGLGYGSDQEYTETSAGKSITFNTVNARYARFYSNGSSVNNYNHYSEIKVYANLASKRVQAASSVFKNLAYATDGTASAGSYADSGTNSGLQWVQADLGTSCSVSEIKLWHYFGDARKYHDVIVQLSNDPTFQTAVTTVYNNDLDNSAGLGAGTSGEYAESGAGMDITFNALNARYVRFYSNGSTANGCSHYSEIGIYGK